VFKLLIISPLEGVAEDVGFVVDVVQPLIDTRTSAPIKSNGSAYFKGILIYRFIMLAIGFIFFPRFAPAVTYATSVTQNVRSRNRCVTA
jgi:hypothetical protein